MSKWIGKLDAMNDDDDGRSERLLYVKYLARTLSGPFGLAEPFTSAPPETVKPLRTVLPAVVFADLLDDRTEGPPRSPRTPEDRGTPTATSGDGNGGALRDDKKFFERQLFPSDGLLCYAAAFSVPDP